MLKLLMKSNKALVITKPQRLYQRETMSNQMCIYIPHELSDYDMSKFMPNFKWINAANIVHVELLEAEESDKEGYLKYVLPLDTQFTALAGDNTAKLTLIWQNEDLSSIDQRLALLKTEADQLSAITAELPTKMAKDLELNGQTLKLVNEEGALMGEGVSVVTGIDEPDGLADAIVSLDDISDDGSTTNPQARAADLQLTADLLQLLSDTGKTMGDGVKILVVPPEGDSSSDGQIDLETQGDEPPIIPEGNPEGDDTQDGQYNLDDLNG